MTQSRYLDELRKRVLVYDGAMGTSVQNLNPTAEDYGGKEGCNEYLVFVAPRMIESIHRSFLEAGADVVETDTFGGSRLKLDEYGIGEHTLDLNRAAARLARSVADEFSTPERPRFVAGSMGPTGMLPSSDDPTLGNITYDELATIFEEQAQGLVEGGCDLLLIETSQDILEVKAAIAGIRHYFSRAGTSVPIQAQVTLDTSGRMLLGTDIGAVLVILEALDVDVVGLNCSTGPGHMREPVRYLCANSRLPISVIPNAGLPRNEGGRAVYPLEPGPMADELAAFVSEFGVNVVGGCCGSTPEHIRQLRQCVDQLTAAGLPPRPAPLTLPALASPIHASALVQEPPPMLVGERVNTLGSRKVKKMLLDDRYDDVVAIARDQMEGGAHALDVCVATTERTDEAEQMRRLVKKLGMSVEAPLMIDSTEPDVIEAALKTYGGRAIINSINMENGRAKIDAVLPLAREHGAAVVAMTIDERGMARLADRKFDVAERMYRIATEEYGLPPHALVFDAQVLPLSTGQEEERNAGVETLNAIRRIKAELPGALTVLGVSNVSFGLGVHARAVLNSVFLHHAVEAGLDLAIVNPKDVVPYAEIPIEQRSLTDAVVFNQHPEALGQFITYFEQHAPSGGRSGEPAVDPMAGLTPAEQIHYQILHRIKDGIEDRLDLVLLERSPVDVLNGVLLPAMKDVGDKFGAGELILPFVLQSAEVMKRAVAYLERFLEKKEGYTKGKVVLATVFGDVHDIGKNLVNTILTNNGYTVFDLGKQVPLNTIIDKAVEVGADAIGLSALLVSTSKQMPLVVQELHKRGLSFPVVIGGAAINRAYGYRILFLDGTEATQPYAPGVFYAKDAFEGLDIVDTLTDTERVGPLVERVRQEARDALHKPVAEAPAPRTPRVLRPPVARDVPIPTPPFWGARVMGDVELTRVFKHLSLRSLFRLSWGGKNAHGAAWTELLRTDFMPRLRRMQREALESGYLAPRVVYGYFPCQADGDDLIVYDPAAAPGRGAEVARFVFPRQDDDDRLSISDYFAPVDSGRHDVVALQVVTLGHGATERTQELQDKGDYAEMFFVHGLSVETAEALAEYAHRQVRRDLNLGPTQGKRYSWGYPACPDLQDHTKVFGLLRAAELIGVNLTEAYQLVPEQSTAAIIVHHPAAKYFMVREGKRDVQLAAAALGA